ncbi:MAG: hypothetical protein JWN53_2275 [Gemmatimonadetes bacterium]|nr:hypothetical protein [Gemmatimonadota bacterium]
MKMPSTLGRGGLSALLLLGACATGAPTSGRPDRVPTPVVVVHPTEPREQTADQQVHQVLNRLAFGPRPRDVARVREMGVDNWIALQLAPDRIDDGATERVLASYEMLGRPTRDLMSMYEEGQLALRAMQKQAAQSGDSLGKKDLRAEVLRDNPQLRDKLRQNQRILGDVQSAKLARAVVSERQLDEVMTDFWENHFTVFAGKGLTRMFIPAYDRDVIRPLALGRFRDLLGAVAKSPAMLFFLDQWQSAADSLHPTLAEGQLPAVRRGRPLPVAFPQQQQQQQQQQQLQQRRRGLNENFARELLELHTLGVDGGYTQHDVIDVARALTGWTMLPRQGAEFTFRPQIHDAGENVVVGHRFAVGRGVEYGEEVLDILARDPHTARFIARKLAIRFVSDDPPPALVDRAADTFRRTDGDIREVVRTIVTSPEFFSRSAYRSKVKSPFELVASALRAVGAQADTTVRSAQMIAFLGQPIFGHQAPNGWPETGEAWMNTGAILNRINFGLALAAGRLPGAALAQWPDAPRLAGASREAQVDGVVSAFLGGQSSPDTRDILLKGENPMVARLGSTAGGDTLMRASDAPPSPEIDAMMSAVPGKQGELRAAAQRRAGAGVMQPVQLNGLAQVVGLAIGAPEFQRR